MKYSFAFIAIAGLISTMSLSAKQVRSEEVTLEPGEGLAAAVVRGGCTDGWWVDAMKSNGIGAWELNQLPIGLVIRLPKGCDRPAPHAVARQVTTVVGVVKALEGAERANARLAEAQTAIAALKLELEQQQAENHRLTADNSAATAAAATAKKVAPEVQSDASPSQSSYTTKQAAIFGALSGSSISVLVLGILFWQWRKRMVIFPETITRWYEGKNRKFPSTTPAPTYGCSEQGCHEKHLSAGRCVRHLETHIEIRREVIWGEESTVETGEPVFSSPR
jgi:hypothetical protein